MSLRLLTRAQVERCAEQDDRFARLFAECEEPARVAEVCARMARRHARSAELLRATLRACPDDPVAVELDDELA